VGYLFTAAGLVGFAATIGWFVGDDTARGIESVSARLRGLASHGSADSAVPLLAADEIGELAAAAMEIERRLRREETAAAAAGERERIARELRAIVTDMRSRDGGEPFAESVQRVAGRHPDIDLEIEGDLERIGPLARFEILRMVEEGLRNAERHAGATAIVARVALRDGHVRLEVEDDGRGIDTDDFHFEQLADQGRYGLIGIRERAELLRGTLTIERRPQGGTLVRVAFPLTGP
jgi:signal transduction histidine kinase